jgi:RNA polymerase-binding protein DksA
MAERSRGLPGAAHQAVQGAAESVSASGEPAQSDSRPGKSASPAKRATAKKATAKKAPAKKNSAGKKVPGAKKVATSTKKAAAPSSLPVREDEAPWTTEELEGVRHDLEANIDRLRQEITDADIQIADLIRDSGDGAGDDQADSGSKAFEREHEMTLANNSRDLLAQIRRALQRIADGSYGSCESCGNPIGKRRLQAFPRATLCVACKQRAERH